MPHVELPSAEFKVVLLGDTNTGKTCLVLRLVEGSYKPSARSSTVGAFFLTKRLTVNNITCKMLLWDTAGQEQFQKLAVTYYQHAAAAIVCYDSSNPSSVVRLKKSMEELDRYIKQNHPMVLAVAACKSDLLAVPGLEEEARRIAKQYDALYFPKTSAKMNQGVTDVFQKTAARVLEWHELSVTGQARPLPVTVGSQRGPSSASKGSRSSPHKQGHQRARSTGYISPSGRTSMQFENDPIIVSTPGTNGAANTTTTPLTGSSSAAIPGVGSGGVGGTRSMGSFGGVVGGKGDSSGATAKNHPGGDFVSKRQTAAPPDQDSNTTANESDDTNDHQQQQQHSQQFSFNYQQDDVKDGMNSSSQVPRLNCDGTYLVCGVDGNDKNCVIS